MEVDTKIAGLQTADLFLTYGNIQAISHLTVFFTPELTPRGGPLRSKEAAIKVPNTLRCIPNSTMAVTLDLKADDPYFKSQTGLLHRE